MSEPTLILEIEVPGYFLGDIPATFVALNLDLTDDAFAEEAEQSMQLASEDVGLTFAHHSGDDPRVCIRAMDGQIVGIRVKR